MEKLEKEKKKAGICTRNRSFVYAKNTKGITLVALVVTIVVLLILAGVTIMMLFGENGIIKKAEKAKEETNQKTEDEQKEFNTLIDSMDEALGIVKIPEGLKVGSEVTYNPSGTYEWKHKYCSSSKAEKASDGTTDAFDLLESGKDTESGTDKPFNISSWKVLSIDETTGKVELVPSSLTSGTVYLGEAQGYNNGVKLLNDACSKLYGNSSKGITARSIKIEDIQDYMLPEKLTETTASANTTGNPEGGHQVSSAYSASHSKYPVIYGKEKLAVINGAKPEGANLDLSEQNTLIERTEGTSTTSAIGAITTASSIQPYQTYWYKDGSYMSSAFKDCPQNSKVDNYYKLIMPKGTSTTYWVASRCVGTSSIYCQFYVRYVGGGGVYASNMYYSYDGPYHGSRALFPVVTLSSNLIEGDATSGFSVK